MLTETWFIAVVSAVTVGSLVLAVGPAWRCLRRPFVATAVVIAIVAVFFELANPLDYRFPYTFYLWSAIPVFAVALTIFGWGGTSARTRIAHLVSVPVCVMFALATINHHYAYAPNLAALFGQTARDAVELRDLDAMRDAVRRTGSLPERGAVVRIALPADHSGFKARKASVYLPPAWFADPEPAVPAVLLLSGTPGTPVDWTRSGGADVIADDFAARHGGMAPILVMADALGAPLADPECVDSSHGKVETYLLDDVMPGVERRFMGTGSGHRWAVAGNSLGGTCALLLTLRHPDRFVGSADLSGDAGPNFGSPKHTVQRLFDGSWQQYRDHDPATLLHSREYEGVDAWFEVGTRDRGPLRAARTLAALAPDAHLDTCLVVRSGGHNFSFWHTAFTHVLPWLSALLTVDAPAGPFCTAAGGTLRTTSAPK
jgi:S-formylglutathione hydrolase FrmB